MDARERRTHPRKRVSWPVRVRLGDNLIIGRAVDVSERGLCVLTVPAGDLTPGRSCRLHVILDATRAVSCTAEVRHVTDSLIGLQTVERFRFL